MKHKAVKAAVFTLIALSVGGVVVTMMAQFMNWWIHLSATNPDTAGMVGLVVIALVAGSMIFSWAWKVLSEQEEEKTP